MQKTQLTVLIEEIDKTIDYLKGMDTEYDKGQKDVYVVIRDIAIEMLPKERKQIIDGIQLGYDYYGARYATNKKKIFDITFTQYKP